MAKQPKIRFKGFTEEWKETSLGEQIKEAGIKNKDNLPLESYSITNEAGFIPQTEQFENGGSMANADKSMYSIVQPYSFAYNPARINVGSIGYYSGEKDIIVSSLYIVFKTNSAIHDPFLMTWFKTDIFNHLVSVLQEGGVRQYFFYDKMVQCPIFLPSKQEQNKIAELNAYISRTIYQRETELEKLKNIKRALLEKLFPQDGQSTPAIRFKGFNEKWSDVPFGKLIIENKEVSTVENEDTLLSSAIEGMFLNSELFDHQRGQSNIGYRKITKGMLILSAQNLHLGNANVNLRFDHGIVSPAYKTYNIQGADTEFMAVWVKREETKAFFDKATTAGASKCRKNIDWDDLYQQNLAMPLDDEQKKIGKFILTLDRLITLREKHIKQLKHSKQALLEQMFVNE